MSKILSGQVEIDLGGDTVALLPTLNAATRISRQFGGFQGALQRIQASDLDAYVSVIQHAIGMRTEAETKGLREKVWGTGLNRLVLPLTEYVLMLANGGRALDEPAEDDASQGKGEG
jgi:hypothetical protein